MEADEHGSSSTERATDDGSEARFLYTPRYDQDRIYLNLFRRHWSAYYHRHEVEVEEYQKKVVERFILCGDPKEGFAQVRL